LSLIDLINIFFLAALSVFWLLTGNRSPYFSQLIILYVIIFLVILIMARWRIKLSAANSSNIILFSYPIILFIVMYESLAALLPFFNDMRYDSAVEMWDQKLLGISPTLWLQQYTTPMLTELMYFFYLIYFPLPLVLVLYLLANKKYSEAEQSIFTLFICYYGAYICYFFIPVTGPKYFLEQQYSVSLDGLFFSEPIRQLINFCEPSQLDCFPSLHAAILIVTLTLSFRYHRSIFYYFHVAGVGIMFSLVYLRYHYFTDVLAGAAWAFVSIYLSQWFWKKYHHRFLFHFKQIQS
jgi:membrane-associated phospholipid phosphatase